ncbi:unnamed protein product [Microthlaspi erraticum]|uniref:Uncharacterized protein n=1 Tax=Microthlaspi erraticum TaxID=1685480 RepID=A0A6D2KNW9_9BRAS|nr:unnamed protein product [Microthlaspi erraticum]
MARTEATTGQRRIHMPNMRNEGNPTTFNPGGIEKQFGRSRTQLARVKKEISHSQSLSRPESTNQATTLDHLPNGTTKVHKTSQANSKHQFGQQIQKIRQGKVLSP